MMTVKYMLTAIVILVSGCSKVQEPLIDRTQIHMATFVTLSLPKDQTDHFEGLFEKVAFLESLFSTYQSEAELAQLNQLKTDHKPSAELRRILELSKKINKETYGYFDISIGSVTKGVYHFGENSQSLPSKESLNEARVNAQGIHVGSASIILDKGVTLDLGGIAKGFSVDLLKKDLIKAKVKAFKIAFSGDIYCQGRCDVAIVSPFKKNSIYKKLELVDSGISTSGNYERFIKSTKFNHLINPLTKQSQQAIASITLISKKHSNAELDAFATALSVMPKALRTKFLKEHQTLNYLIIYNDKSVEQRL